MTRQSFLVWAVHVAKVVGLAAAYWVAGRLGLLLAIPPGYATAIWAPSGIALAGLVILGKSAWPGVFIGSFLVNVGTSFDFGTPQLFLQSLAIPGVIALGATIQAAVGRYLIVRYVGNPTSLLQEKDVVKFLGLGGPASCLVNATIGVTTLLVAGRIQPVDYMVSWCTWWIGDTIGVLVITPLALIAAGQPRDAWRRRAASVGLPLGLNFFVVILLLVLANRREQNRLETGFARRTQALGYAISLSFEGYHDVLSSIRSLFAAVDEVDQQAFSAFVEPLLSRHPGIQALSWNPRILAADRAAFEEGARQSPPMFQITEKDSQLNCVRAGARDEYFPVLFIEPNSGNETARGFDVNSEPVRRTAMHRAAEIGTAVATIPIRLDQDKGELGVIVFQAIYSQETALTPPAIPRKHLRGFVAGTFLFEDMIRASLSHPDAEEIEIELFDEAAPVEQRMLFARPSAVPGEPLGSASKASPSNLAWMSASSTVDFGNRSWTLRVTATQKYLATQRSWQTWLVLTTGLLFTSLLGGFLLVLTGRTTRIELLVSERTAELSHANTTLARQITERKQIESRFRNLLETAPDAMVIVNQDGRIVLVNSQAEKMFGYAREELFGKAVEMLIPEPLRAQHRIHREGYVIDPRVRSMGEGLALRGLRKDGSEIPVEISLSPLATEEGVLVSSAIRDISERQRLEEESRRHQEGLAHVRRLATMGALATGLAHELNQPLCAIVSNADAAQRMLESTPEAPDELRETLMDVSHEAMRAAEIIQHLRDFVRKGSPKRTQLEINKVIREISYFIGSNVAEHRATLRLELAKGGLTVVGDRIQLQQVILNLVRNGLDAMVNVDADSRILTIRTSQVESGEIEIAVQDRGVGLSPEMIDHAFEPFVTTKDEGLGLGLSFSRELVEALGGRLMGKPNSDCGTTFCVYLPVLEDRTHDEVRSNRDHR